LLSFGSKLELETLQDTHEKIDSRASVLGKQVTSLETQLAESQERTNEETKQRQTVQSKLRQAEERLASMQDQLDEEEEGRKNLETKVTSLSAQVP